MQKKILINYLFKTHIIQIFYVISIIVLLLINAIQKFINI